MAKPIFNKDAAELIAEPERYYRTILSDNPVHLSPEGYWVVTPYAEVRRLLSSTEASVGYHILAEENPPVAAPFRRREVPWLVNLDNPRHDEVRAVVEPYFSGRALQELANPIRTIAKELIARLPASGAFDCVSEFAYPLPATVIMGLLGFEPQEWRLYQRWFADRAALFCATHTDDPQLEARCAQARVEVIDFLEQRLREKRYASHSLLTALASAEQQGALSHDELLANAVLLMFAGYETTRTLIGNCIYLMTKFQVDQSSLLEPTVRRAFIEEVLRFAPPTSFAQRILLSEQVVGGVTIPKGAYLRLFICAANRDPAQFPNPDTFDPTRKPNAHLSFGYGGHFCLGAKLARLETDIALEELLRHFGTVADVGQPPVVVDHATLPSLASYAVKAGAAPSGCPFKRALSAVTSPFR